MKALDPNAASQCPTCHAPLSVDLNAPSGTAAQSYHRHGETGHADGDDGDDDGAAGGGGGGGGAGGAAALNGAMTISGTAAAARGGVAAAGRAKRGILSRIDLRHFQSSTKIEALMEELHLMKEADPSSKAIVFSQYVSFLDLLEHRLMAAGIRVVKLNGGMAASQRDAMLRMFM